MALEGGGGEVTPATVLSHCRLIVVVFSLFLKGEMLSVFFSFCVFCVWFGVFCRFFLFLGSLFEKFFGSRLLVFGLGVGRVFFGSVFLMFLLYVLSARSRKCLENSLDVRSCFFGSSFSLLFGVFRRRRFFCRFLGESSGQDTPHTHFVFVFLSLVFVPAAPGLSPVLAVRPSFLAFRRGAILDPGRFGDF